MRGEEALGDIGAMQSLRIMRNVCDDPARVSLLPNANRKGKFHVKSFSLHFLTKSSWDSMSFNFEHHCGYFFSFAIALLTMVNFMNLLWLNEQFISLICIIFYEKFHKWLGIWISWFESFVRKQTGAQQIFKSTFDNFSLWVRKFFIDKVQK